MANSRSHLSNLSLRIFIFIKINVLYLAFLVFDMYGEAAKDITKRSDRHHDIPDLFHQIVFDFFQNTGSIITAVKNRIAAISIV